MSMKKYSVIVTVDDVRHVAKCIRFLHRNSMDDWEYTGGKFIDKNCDRPLLYKDIKYKHIHDLISMILKIAKEHQYQIPYYEAFGGKIYSIYICSMPYGTIERYVHNED